METDLVVVGGGPAGISAATAAAQHGVRVALVDEQPSLGGRLRGLLHEKRNSDGAGAWTNGPALSARMEVEAQEAGVQILSGRSEEHTSELQSRQYLVCRLLLEKKKKTLTQTDTQNA